MTPEAALEHSRARLPRHRTHHRRGHVVGRAQGSVSAGRRDGDERRHRALSRWGMGRLVAHRQAPRPARTALARLPFRVRRQNFSGRCVNLGALEADGIRARGQAGARGLGLPHSPTLGARDLIPCLRLVRHRDHTRATHAPSTDGLPLGGNQREPWHDAFGFELHVAIVQRPARMPVR
jgi:hypothetical protein